MRVRENNAEKELAEIGVDERSGGFRRQSQWEPMPGLCATGNGGNIGEGRPFEWRRERNTRSFFHL